MIIKKTVLAVSALLSSITYANIVVEASSDNPTPVVVETGGKVNFDRTIKNTGSSPVEIRYYDNLIFPNGQLYSRSKPKNLTLEANGVFEQTRPVINVPDKFPAGDYQYVFSAYNKSTGEITSASFQFNKKFSDSDYSNCNEILINGLSRGNGVYTIKPQDASQPYQVYCDMESNGGGWTLVGVKHKTNTNVQVEELISESSEANVLSDEKWGHFKHSTQELLVKIDDSASAILDMAVLNNANCVPLASSLSENVLAWAETEGCTGAGQDYSFLGSNLFVVSVYDYSNTRFIIERSDRGWGGVSNNRNKPYNNTGTIMKIYVR
ncbi:fibrinogen-like YCDxxxxGGGW domain-containing protein [Pseudoalteromonas sp. BZB3]|uniref:fibrinogen-like YCDxxxxGGGW domain-containing protein n=1 Tax=Pseudoalteromonas sp. BZB3 TaxID=3136670 RepID=UPI0032C47214